MIQHAPAGYACPLCYVAGGGECEAVVYSDDEVVAAVSLHQKPRNLGSLLVFPRAHVENLYAVSPGMLRSVFGLVRRLSLALKQVLGAEGVTVVQNNEPAGGQDVWHMHVHVVPRYKGDQFFSHQGEAMSIEERAQLASQLRSTLIEPSTHDSSLEGRRFASVAQLGR